MSDFNLSIIISVFTAGLLSFFSPCIIPLLPVYVGYFSSDDGLISENQKVLNKILKTLFFIAGISVVFFILGFGAGALGDFLSGTTFSIICGIIILFFGLNQAGLIKIPILDRQFNLNWKINGKGFLSVFILGVIFSFGWTPCVGPILASVLSFTAQNGNALKGGLLLIIYSLGLSIPFLIFSIGSTLFLSKLKRINQYLPLIKLIGGLLIAIMGLWMILSQIQMINNSTKLDNSIVSQEGSGENFSLLDVNGETINLSDYQGKPVCIKFWGTWCPSCMAGLESFQELANQVNSQNKVQILSIVAPGIRGEMNKEDFIQWSKSQGWSFPILLDEGAKVNQQFDLQAYPTYLFFDKNRNLVETKVGDIQKEELINILEDLETQ